MEKFGLLALQGGGSGGGLPPVTSSDNGKALTVVNGAWAAADNDFVVTFTKSGDVSGTWSADKTFIEVKNAYDTKKRVYGKMSATAVTSDPAFSSFTLLIPLSGIYGSMPVFSGTYQGQTKTVFVSFVMGVSSITAYVKEIELAPAPLVVDYTITGLPTGNVYPMSTATSFSTISAAWSSGRDVIARITQGSSALYLRAVSVLSDVISFSAITENTASGSGIAFYQITHASTDDPIGLIIPLNTTVMSYNTSTDELSITNVPEVSA